MGKLKTLFLLLKEDPKKIRLAIMRNFSKMKVSRCIPSKLFIKWSYRAYIGKKINLNNPETFNEKLNWLKLYDRCEDYTLLVDKFEVKEYVTRLIGDKYIIPTYGVWKVLMI